MTWQTKHHYLNLITNFFRQFGLTIALIMVLWYFLSDYIHYTNTAELNKKISAQIQVNQQQSQENHRLYQQIQAMNNLEILESEARYRLGLLKSGETYYQY